MSIINIYNKSRQFRKTEYRADDIIVDLQRLQSNDNNTNVVVKFSVHTAFLE